MNDPLARFRRPLKSLDDVRERVAFTEEIKAELKEVKVGDWKILHQYEPDGTYWAEEYPFGEMHGGGPSCLYLIDADDPISYFDTGPYLTSELRKEEDRREFWNALGEENGVMVCRAEGCDRKNIKYSVFCKKHHYESIKKEPCPF